MLQDVWHPGVVRRVCLEADREDIVLVFAGNMQIVGSGLVVLQVQSCQLEFGDMLRAQESEAVDLLSWLRILGELCHRSSDTSLGCVAQHPPGSQLAFLGCQRRESRDRKSSGITRLARYVGLHKS